jgi:hypothetical protein
MRAFTCRSTFLYACVHLCDGIICIHEGVANASLLQLSAVHGAYVFAACVFLGPKKQHSMLDLVSSLDMARARLACRG